MADCHPSLTPVKPGYYLRATDSESSDPRYSVDVFLCQFANYLTSHMPLEPARLHAGACRMRWDAKLRMRMTPGERPTL